MNVDRRRGWDGARAGVGFEQRIERRRRRRRRWRWRWLPGLSTLARFMARRTTTSTRSPPFPLRHITRQTDALPTTVRKNGSTQGVHLTDLFREARLVPKTRAPPSTSDHNLSSFVDPAIRVRLESERRSFLDVSRCIDPNPDPSRIEVELDQDWPIENRLEENKSFHTPYSAPSRRVSHHRNDAMRRCRITRYFTARIR